MAAPSQKIPLNIEKTAKEILGESSSLSRDLQETTRNLRAGRRDAKDMGGFLQLLTGGVNAGNIRDVGGVAEMAADRLARAGHLKQAVALQGMAGIANFTATAIGVGGAVVATAYAGFEVGTALYNMSMGDPQQVKDSATSTMAYQNSVMKSKNLTNKQKLELIQGSGKFQDPSMFSKVMEYSPIGLAEKASDAYHGTPGGGPRWVDDPMRDLNLYMKEKRLGDMDYNRAMWKERRERGMFTNFWETIKGDEKSAYDRIQKNMTEEQKVKAEAMSNKKDALLNSAIGLRSRSLENFRFLQLRKSEESKWSGVKDWSA